MRRDLEDDYSGDEISRRENKQEKSDFVIR
jgi:hypothetical protein